MLKAELAALGSQLLRRAGRSRVDAGGALAVDRDKFSADVTSMVKGNPLYRVSRDVCSDPLDACLGAADATILATGPLTSDALAQWLVDKTGSDNLAFFDAAAPVVMADSSIWMCCSANRAYEQDAPGDYLNAPFDKESYDAFIAQLVAADRVIKARLRNERLISRRASLLRKSPARCRCARFGTCKPVGLTDPATGRRPWAAVQLRAENAQGTAYNLVGFQTNLTFGEQKRVFRMIPGLQNAEFARYGVMHRNTFIQAPRLLDRNLRLRGVDAPCM